MRTATELLRRALEAWDKCDPNDVNDCMEKIRTFLSTPSDDAEEPVAWRLPYIPQPGTFFVTLDPVLAEAFEADEKIKAEPLYLHPPKPAEPARKPMTEDAEDEAFNSASIYAAWLETENRMLREARKPMTEKQIQLLWWEFAIPHSEDEAPREIFIRYTRAIEKHHGIGVDDE